MVVDESFVNLIFEYEVAALSEIIMITLLILKTKTFTDIAYNHQIHPHILTHTYSYTDHAASIRDHHP